MIPLIEPAFLPFLATLIAELGDKSFLTVSLLASRNHRHAPIFIGAMTAYIILNSLTAFAGRALTEYINIEWLTGAAGVIFILFGIKALLINGDESLAKFEAKNLFRTTFGFIFIAEIGDRTNIATGLFSIQYDPLLVLLGVLSALGIITFLAIQVGKWLAQKINHHTIIRIGGILFIVIGILILKTLF